MKYDQLKYSDPHSLVCCLVLTESQRCTRVIYKAHLHAQRQISVSRLWSLCLVLFDIALAPIEWSFALQKDANGLNANFYYQ
jgi:hypothetical protein